MSFPPDTSKLDTRQIFQSVFDEENRRLRTDAKATISNVSIAVDLDPSEDGVYIADKTSGNKLKINPDGSINVVFETTSVPQVNKNIYNEVLSLASGATVSLVSYTVPAGKQMILERIRVSGDNIAKYFVYLNGNKFDAARTEYTSLNADMEYFSSEKGYTLNAGDQVVVTVYNFRPDSADFSGRIQLIEVG